jgi:hypothetical protein
VKKLLIVAVLLWSLGAATSCARAQDAGGEDAVDQARKAYYNLGDAGAKGFRCEVRADWDGLLASEKMDDAERRALLPLLRQMHFEAELDSTGQSEVSHHFDGAEPDAQAERSLRAAIDPVEQMLSGVMQELSSFLYGPPLPAEGTWYKVETLANHFRITAGDEPMIVVETLNKEYAIEEAIVATQNSTATMHPQLKRGEHGYIPTVIDSRVESARAGAAEMHVEIAYQSVEGFDLPQTVKAHSDHSSGDAEVHFTFGKYQLQK